jgi:nucleotide-binding universal stress UspA family protein
MSTTGGTKIKRILVALDDSKKAIDLLRSAAALAAQLDAELIGLFVEDTELLRAADLPIFMEINFDTRTRRKVDRFQIEHIYQERVDALLAEAERMLKEMDLEWRFTIARGSVVEEIQKAASDVDLLVMARSAVSKRRLGSTARSMARTVTANLLLIEPRSRQHTNLLVLYDGSEKSQQALEIASHLAEVQDISLVVVIAADSASAAEELKRLASDWLTFRRIATRFHLLVPPGVKKLRELIGSEGRCMLIIPEDNSMIHRDRLDEVLPKFRCPVFLVS